MTTPDQQPTDPGPGTPVEALPAAPPLAGGDPPQVPTDAGHLMTGGGGSSTLGVWATLPWVLVALLTGLSVLLATSLSSTRGELARARGTDPGSSRTITASPSAPGTAAGSGAAGPVISAQPTTGGNAAQILALAHRTPNDPMAVGRVDAPITMVEWADFRCPFCAKWALETRPELQRFIDSGSLRLEFRDLVLFGDESTLAHAAARAAAAQAKFWPFYEALWGLHTGNGHPEITEITIATIAKRVGIADMAKFNADRKSAAVATAVSKDTSEAQRLGITGTPFFVINTTAISGAQPTASFVSVIEQYGGHA